LYFLAKNPLVTYTEFTCCKISILGWTCNMLTVTKFYIQCKRLTALKSCTIIVFILDIWRWLIKTPFNLGGGGGTLWWRCFITTLSSAHTGDLKTNFSENLISKGWLLNFYPSIMLNLLSFPCFHIFPQCANKIEKQIYIHTVAI
jgi:hypothetical protein